MDRPGEQTVIKATRRTDDTESIVRRLERRRRSVAGGRTRGTWGFEPSVGADWTAGTLPRHRDSEKGSTERARLASSRDASGQAVSKLSMSKLYRKGVLTFFGQAGAVVVSLAGLWLAASVTGIADDWLYPAMAILTAIRAMYCMTREPRPLLSGRVLSRRFGRVTADETKITIVFLAVVFLLDWPLTHAAVGIFAGSNLVGQLILSSVARLALRALNRRLRRHGRHDLDKHVLILGSGKKARQVADTILDAPELEANLVGFLDRRRDDMWRYRDIPLIGEPDELEELAATRQIDALFVAVEGDRLADTRNVFATAERMGIAVALAPTMYEPKVSRMRPGYIKDQLVMVYRAVPENRLTLFVKSLLDKTGALIGLVLVSPIMLLTALAIKIDSRGPVFYRQVRSGLNNRPFYLYKFRTMVDGADRRKSELLAQNEMSGPVFKMQQDPRITRLGRYLRKFSIDELPQFFNVLKGEMSLVGPRPPLPNEVAGFEPWQRRKLSVQPGVTCLWQVNGRNDIDFDDWMKLDLQYIDNWSLWLDAKIVARTIPTVMKGTGV